MFVIRVKITSIDGSPLIMLIVFTGKARLQHPVPYGGDCQKM